MVNIQRYWISSTDRMFVCVRKKGGGEKEKVKVEV